MQRLYRAVWVLLLVASAAPVRGQADCDQLLIRADSEYDTGRFEAALSSLDECLERGPSQTELLAALALRAKALLVIDDRQAAADAVTRLLKIDPDYRYNQLRDPPLFVRLVDSLRVEDTTIKVSSVSKTPESLREAPATVVVVTAEEIERRGYTDLEALLHDLPGFDITRTNGVTYSNVYQRGYRSDLTNRTLFLVDGVEENDVWLQAVYLSRQYPVSSVDKVEVIYGPASTMYGANAFAGVVNVITRQPSDLIREGRKLGARVDVTGGTFDTQILETSVAGRNQHLAWSVTGRLFRSDEQDLSSLPEWDYDTDREDYQSILRISGDAPEYQDFLTFLGLNPGLDCRGQAGCFFDVTDTSIELTGAGAARARELDRVVYQNLDGRAAAFSDETDDWHLSGKLDLANLRLGFTSWQRREGANPSSTDRAYGGGVGGLLWIPSSSSFYGRYERDLGDDLSLTFFARYKRHELEDPSSLNLFTGYAAGPGNLRLKDLIGVDPPTGSWIPFYFYLSNTQLRTELTVSYNPSERLSLVSGIELRNSTVQGNYILSDQPNPAANGTPRPPILTLPDGTLTLPPDGGNQFNVQDLGFYVQASYRLRPDLKLVAGGRVDDNKVRQSGGYGMVFNPRIGLVYAPGDMAFKAIYSEAFQDASNFQKYVLVAGVAELAAPDLQPEKIKNLELSASWQVSDELALEVSAYDADVSDIAAQQRVTCDVQPQCTSPTTLQYRNIGGRRLRGIIANATWRRKNLSLYANYTYTDPFNTEPVDADGQPLAGVDELRIGDIASHQLNFGANARLLRDRLDVNLRLNWVGDKEVGEGTTVSSSPLDRIDPYTVAHAAVTYREVLPGTSLQLLVNNLLDEEYEHPGLRASTGFLENVRSPQPGRTVFLRASWKF